MRRKRLAGISDRARSWRPRRRRPEAPVGEFQARSWREAFERDPSAIGGAGFWLLPVLETGRLVRWFAQLTLGWRGLRRGPPRR